MKKKIKLLSGFAIAMAVGGGVIAGGLTEKIEVMFNSIELRVDGEVVNSPNILYKGTTYVPIRDVAEALGRGVNYNNNTKIAYIYDKEKYGSDDKSAIVGKNIFINLSEKDVASAIVEGKKGILNASSFEDKNYSLNAIKKADSFIKSAKIYTPYLSIVQASAMSQSEYKNVSNERINDLLNQQKNIMPFTIDVQGDSITFTKNFHAVLRQGGHIIQPQRMSGKDNLARRSSKFPNSPAYTARIGADFPAEEIDFTKKAELVVVYLGNYESIFEVDFSKYK